MQSLAVLLRGTLHWTSSLGGAVLDALAECGGVYGTSQFFAARLGLRDRHQLARILNREGLPPLEELAAWVRAIAWVMHSDQYRTPLYRLAKHAHLDPATCYRSVRRLTGANWGDVRDRGVAWMLQQLRERCRKRDGQSTSSAPDASAG